MTVTPILGITELSSNSANAEIVFNEALRALEIAMNTTADWEYTVSNELILTQAQFASGIVHRIEGTISDDLLFGIPAVSRFFIVDNQAVSSVIVYVDDESGVQATVTPGTCTSLYSDGVNVKAVGVADEDGGAPAVNLTAFNGATGQLTSVSTGAFAIKGSTWTPRVNVTIDALWATIDASATSQNHAGIIAQVDTMSGGTIVAVVGTSPSVASVSTQVEAMRFPFTTPLTLIAGTPYLIAAINQSGVGTTVNRIGITDLAAAIWEPNAPGSSIGGGAFDYNTTTLSVSQAPSGSNAAIKRCVWLEGSYEL